MKKIDMTGWKMNEHGVPIKVLDWIDINNEIKGE